MMDIRAIKNDKSYFWTNHSKYKILQYNLSPTAIKRVIKYPERTEDGIAPDTTAVMKRKDGKKNKSEVWVMYQKNIKNQISKIKNKKISAGKIRIISAWIYPGVSPKGKEIFIPEDVWDEIKGVT